jgi:hypothetical protein
MTYSNHTYCILLLVDVGPEKVHPVRRSSSSLLQPFSRQLEDLRMRPLRVLKWMVWLKALRARYLREWTSIYQNLPAILVLHKGRRVLNHFLHIKTFQGNHCNHALQDLMAKGLAHKNGTGPSKLPVALRQPRRWKAGRWGRAHPKTLRSRCHTVWNHTSRYIDPKSHQSALPPSWWFPDLCVSFSMIHYHISVCVIH